MKTILKRYYDLEGRCIEGLLPAHNIICPDCDGEGKHVHRSIGSLSSVDFEDPDFNEAYLRGDYDVSCTECNGERVIVDVDWDLLSEEQKTGLMKYEDEVWASEQEARMERRLGC